jgi:hypothetical protein
MNFTIISILVGKVIMLDIENNDDEDDNGDEDVEDSNDDEDDEVETGGGR